VSDMVLQVHHLSKHYGKIKALDRLSLALPRGSVFGLIGPNGAGKTTALRIIAGVLEADGGEIVLDGRPVNGDRAYRAGKIGYMPDFFGVYPDLMTWEYLDFFGRTYGIPAKQRSRRIDDLLELVDLAGKKFAFVQSLSRGMQQRLCLARALVHDPELLLLDEPASGLDPRARVAFRQLVKKLQTLGKTILVSSHILLELAEICDQVAILEKGELRAAGTMEAIKPQLHAQRRTLRVRSLDDSTTLSTFLERQDGVSNIRQADDHLEVDFDGGEEAVAALLRRMIEAGFRLLAFEEISSNLEDLYLQLTKGETQ